MGQASGQLAIAFEYFDKESLGLIRRVVVP